MQHLAVWAVAAALAELCVLTTAPAGGWPDKVGLAGCWPAKICSAARAARAWPANVQQLAAASSPVKGALARAGVVPAVEAGPAPVPKSELLPGRPGPNVGPCRPQFRLGLCFPKELGWTAQQEAARTAPCSNGAPQMALGRWQLTRLCCPANVAGLNLSTSAALQPGHPPATRGTSAPGQSRQVPPSPLGPRTSV